jgi:hypothetical protein
MISMALYGILLHFVTLSSKKEGLSRKKRGKKAIWRTFFLAFSASPKQIQYHVVTNRLTTTYMAPLD